ncbi:helix-turn-helix domain-containing protein [mine drainage metagenome]|uniref:Helix-turn-helix domain-containing protein n=1 Tax=mine drainage metagenome TaxID=410659 RepID=T1C7P1_9ZZZZ
MGKLTAKQRIAWEAGRDLNAELRDALADARWVRRTDFVPLTDGRVRRRILRRDGTIENEQVIPAERVAVAAARAGTGLSQTAFAALLGVSVRTLQDWEQGRRTPSGAAQTLLRIAAQHPHIVREAAA